MAGSTALRRSGRSMVTTVTGPVAVDLHGRVMAPAWWNRRGEGQGPPAPIGRRQKLD